MTALVFRWRQPPPPLLLRFRGLDDATLAALDPVADPLPLAAIVGAPGRNGIDGQPGPEGPPGPGVEDPGDLVLLFENRLI